MGASRCRTAQGWKPPPASAIPSSALTSTVCDRRQQEDRWRKCHLSDSVIRFTLGKLLALPFCLIGQQRPGQIMPITAPFSRRDVMPARSAVVLLVESHDDSHDMYADYLRECGFTVRTADTTDEG